MQPVPADRARTMARTSLFIPNLRAVPPRNRRASVWPRENAPSWEADGDGRPLAVTGCGPGATRRRALASAEQVLAVVAELGDGVVDVDPGVVLAGGGL